MAAAHPDDAWFAAAVFCIEREDRSEISVDLDDVARLQLYLLEPSADVIG